MASNKEFAEEVAPAEEAEAVPEVEEASSDEVAPVEVPAAEEAPEPDAFDVPVADDGHQALFDAIERIETAVRALCAVIRSAPYVGPAIGEVVADIEAILGNAPEK